MSRLATGRVRRLAPFLVTFVMGAGIAACGSASSTTQAPTAATQAPSSQTTTQPTTPTADLGVDSPGDGDSIAGPTVMFKGTATPSAHVLVTLNNGGDKGTNASRNGAWRLQVPLDMGDNSLQVVATRTGYLESSSISLTITRTQTRAEIAAAKAAAAQRAASEKQSFINDAQTIPYAQLIKDTTPYEGKKIALHGQIFQIQQQQGQGGIMLLSVTDAGYGIWTDNVWVDYDNDIPYAEKDVITVYGTVTGVKSYQTQAGGTTYVPEVPAKYVQQS